MRELRDLRRGRVLIGANEAAVHTLLPLMAQIPRTAARHCRRRPAGAGAADRGGGAAGQPRLRRVDVPAVRDRPARSGGRHRRTGAARGAVPSAGAAASGHDGGRGRRAGGRPQRSVAGARTRAAAVRAAPHHPQHGDRAAQPRWHQARGRDEAGRGAAAAPLRDHGNRQRQPGGDSRRRHLAPAAGDAGLPQRASLARRQRVPRGRAGEDRRAGERGRAGTAGGPGGRASGHGDEGRRTGEPDGDAWSADSQMHQITKSSITISLESIQRSSRF